MTDDEEIPPIRESLREGYRQVETVVGTWIALATVSWVLGLTLVAVSGQPSSRLPAELAMGVTLVVSVVGTALLVRYRPGATDRLGTFLLISVGTYLGLVTVVFRGPPPADAVDPVLAVPAVIVAWVLAVGMGYLVVYRNGHRRLLALFSRTDS